MNGSKSMKPCGRNRKQIASLAVNALGAQEADDLQAHIRTCEGCRRYLGEISLLTRSLASLETPLNIQTSENFHRLVVGALNKMTVAPLIQPSAPGRHP